MPQLAEFALDGRLVVFALAILVTAGLLIRSFMTLVRVDPGFARSNVVITNLQYCQLIAVAVRKPSASARSRLV